MSVKRFRVALSFAGEKRDFVAHIASILAAHFNKAEILYDQYHVAEFAMPRLQLELPKLYYDESELVVVIVSSDYNSSDWCGLELDAIVAKVAKRRHHEVMLAHFGHAEIEGLYGAGYVSLDGLNAEQFADLILERLARNEGKSKDYYKKSTLVTKVPVALPGFTAHAVSGVIRRTFACQFDQFHGRSEELAVLARAFRDPKRSGAIIGAIGGMGKTALGYQFCSSYKCEESFDLVVGASSKETYLDLDEMHASHNGLRQTGRTMRTVQSYLLEIARQLGMREAGALHPDRVEEEIRTATDGRRVLFLLDNLETVNETATMLALLYRLCSSPKHRFLVTARAIPDGLPNDIARIPLHRLNDDEACALVHDLFGYLRLNTAGSHDFADQAVTVLLKRAQGHPLALRLLTGKLFAEGENAILSMPEVAAMDDGHQWTHVFFNFVFDQSLLDVHLGTKAVAMACVVASYPDGLREKALARVLRKIDPSITSGDFEDLLRRLFLTFCVYYEYSQGENILAMHPLTREFFVGLQNSNDARLAR